MRLILVRHGETTWNRDGLIQGSRSDTELSEAGLDQAAKIAQALRREQITAVYTSPLQRAARTAHEVAKMCGLEASVIPDLQEIDAGELEGLSGPETLAQHGEFWTEWVNGNYSLVLPGGESLQQVQDRVWQQVENIRERHPDGTVVIVSHLFVILTLICKALGIDISHFPRIRLSPGAINILDLSPDGNRLITLNDTCHLEHDGTPQG